MTASESTTTWTAPDGGAIPEQHGFSRLPARTAAGTTSAGPASYPRRSSGRSPGQPARSAPVSPAAGPPAPTAGDAARPPPDRSHPYSAPEPEPFLIDSPSAEREGPSVNSCMQTESLAVRCIDLPLASGEAMVADGIEGENPQGFPGPGLLCFCEESCGSGASTCAAVRSAAAPSTSASRSCTTSTPRTICVPFQRTGWRNWPRRSGPSRPTPRDRHGRASRSRPGVLAGRHPAVVFLTPSMVELLAFSPVDHPTTGEDS